MIEVILAIALVGGGHCVGTCEGQQVFQLSDGHLYLQKQNYYVPLTAVQKQAVVYEQVIQKQVAVPVVKQVVEKTYVAPVFAYSHSYGYDGQIQQQLLEELRAMREQDASRDQRFDNLVIQQALTAQGFSAQALRTDNRAGAQAIFQTRCVSCHRPGGAGEAAGDFSNGLTAKQARRSMVETAKQQMPPKPGSLSDQEYTQVIDYLESVIEGE